MKLIERDNFLSLMHTNFERVAASDGHCILVSGEAGIGKTSLVKTFCKKVTKECKFYQGTCDALFTPRPLGPVFDIIWQMHGLGWENSVSISDRSALFNRFHYELVNQEETTIIIIEDIHWADEATLDFIKFFARRITRLHCLFILTYRDDEIHTHHPLRTVLGQLSTDSFTRLKLVPLSREAVDRMAVERGYNGENVYSISGGNPFYVNEILASYSPGIPDNIKDSILSIYNRRDEKTKKVWQILSVQPTGFEIRYLEKMEPSYATAIQNCLDSKILISKDGLISFKHELYRRTTEISLSPHVRVALNKRILDLFLKSFEQNEETERIIHHAKNANEYETVVKYAPIAAKQAATVGAHIEAAKLYLTAIEYYQGNDRKILIQFYELYAYECHLTNQIREAIVYTTKALKLWDETIDVEKKGNCLRFLSRLWWFDGNRKKAETYASQAIEVLEDQPTSSTKAMAYSNMSQLKMLSNEFDECIAWGEKAIGMAKELANEEILCHALNNVGASQTGIPSLRSKGIELLQQSLQIAIKNSYDDHAGRAYANLASNAVKMKDNLFAKKILEEGIQYCEERGLDTYNKYLAVFKAWLSLNTGIWNEAYHIAENLIKNTDQHPIVKIEAIVIVATIKMRRGHSDILPLLIEAKEKAFETMEPQRILPVLTALLEYEWIMGTSFVKKEDIDHAIPMVPNGGNMYLKNKFCLWLLKARKQKILLPDFLDGYQVDDKATAMKSSALWKKLNCPYEQALTLFEGDDNDKRAAIEIVQKLGADAIYEKMKFEMRASGIKSIPRGIRKSTKSNPANLTDRELDVIHLLKDGMQNKEIAARLFISPKTVDHHISSIFFKLEVNSRTKAVKEAISLEIIK